MDLIAEAVNYGSCFEAIYSGEVSVPDLLDYLVTAPITDRTLYAYRAACQFSSPSRHYLRSGKHFIVQVGHYDYLAIYMKLGDLSAPESIDSSVPISTAMKDKIRDLDGKPHLMERALYLCTTLPVLLLNESFRYIDDIVACRNLNQPGLTMITELIQQAISPSRFLNHDHLIMLDLYHPKDYRDFLVDRVVELATKAPTYWARVVRPAYNKLIRDKFLGDRLLLSKSQLLRLTQHIPNLVEPWVWTLSDQAWALLRLTSTHRAYCLGYPIDGPSLSSTELRQTLELLTKLGVDQYCQLLADRHRQVMLDSNKTPIHSQLELVNQEDTLCEKPEAYHPFDVVCLRKDNLLFRFTRPEFPNLLETKINPWNKEELPPLFLVQLVQRLQLASIAKLPDSAPLHDLLTN